jgi:hypothetical protein
MGLDNSHPYVFQTFKSFDLEEVVVDGVDRVQLAEEIMGIAVVVVLGEIFAVGCLSVLVLLDFVAVLLLTNHHSIVRSFFERFRTVLNVSFPAEIAAKTQVEFRRLIADTTSLAPRFTLETWA